MPRNLFERCEVVFPIRDVQVGARIRKEILAALLADRAKARILCASGEYQRVSQPEGKNPGFGAQEFFMQVAEGKTTWESIPVPVVVRSRGAAGSRKNARAGAAPRRRIAK